MKRILIVEDDERICRLEQDYLEANEFETVAATDGISGLSLALQQHFDLILLDIMLPRLDGLEVCRRIREESNVPILLVSAKKEDLDKIKGLGVGADDYIVKPFSPKELVARITAHINRYERLTSRSGMPPAAEVIEIDNIRLDPASRLAHVDNQEVVLTNKEFDLFYFLACNPNVVFSKEDLFKEIWKYDSMGETSTITVHVNRIRDKIKEVSPESEYIHTVWGHGYRFKK